jgi:hypothetical protein
MTVYRVGQTADRLSVAGVLFGDESSQITITPATEPAMAQ